MKCLGMYIGHDKIECYDKNWMKVYHDIETLFESWEKRKWTLFGKCSVINSQAYVKLIYTASIFESPEDEFIKK